MKRGYCFFQVLAVLVLLAAGCGGGGGGSADTAGSGTGTSDTTTTSTSSETGSSSGTTTDSTTTSGEGNTDTTTTTADTTSTTATDTSASTTATTESSTSVAESSAFQDFLAQGVASNYSNGTSYAKAVMKARQSTNPRLGKTMFAATVSQLDTGWYYVDYSGGHTTTSLGTTYTYTAGGVYISFLDYWGYYTDSANAVDFIAITGKNLTYSYKKTGITYSCIDNGTVGIGGLYYETSVYIGFVNFNTTWTTSLGDSVSWSIPDSSVYIAWPNYYPSSTSYEYGTVNWNGNSFSYAIDYTGTRYAYVTVSDGGTATFTIDLATGTVYAKPERGSDAL